MTCAEEYHSSVRHSVLFLSLFALTLFLVPRSNAQVNGAPSSVTSPGFGGRAINGPPASVTSLGSRGYAPNPHVRFSTSAPGRIRNRDGNRQRHHYGEFNPPLMYAVPVPYAVDNGAPNDDEGYYDNGDPDNDPNYQGGPTIFDRRGEGARSYIPPVNDASSNLSQDSASDTEPTPEPVDPTVLVFKDGHQMEVNNYAIVGATLFDLTPGHVRKIALADLNLDATRKQNDDRGVLFQLPPSARVN
ncbi:MAG: hypothetical protein WAM79_19210 [Candidatus Sulfotelmatobacter sp.]